MLDEALTYLAGRRPAKPQDVLAGLAKGLRESLLVRLTQRGILHADEGKILGIFPTRSWPAADPAHENAVRRGLYDVLWVGRSPEPREAALISLLHAVDQVPVVVSGSPLSKRDLRRHAKEIAAGDFAGEAVRTGIDGVNAAVTTSILAATTASSAGSH